jgi:mono/diheme cytochrome c family protein
MVAGLRSTGGHHALTSWSIPMNAKFAFYTLLLVPACGDKDDTSVESPVARGQYIVDHVAVCQDCHTPRDEMGAPIAAQYLAGAACFAALPSGSCLNTRNLTNHETGLLNRTDAEIKRMIRDGIRPAATGDEPLSPVMPYYIFHNMTDADLDAVVAYLRTVPGVDHAIDRSGPEFEVQAAANPLDTNVIPMPMTGYVDTPAALRGRYLASQAGVCLECHTQHLMADPNVVDYSAIFAGGEEFQIGLPVAPVSSNLTSDPETGLGNWTIDDIVRVIKEGKDTDSAGICPPMPVGPMGPFAGLTDADARDIAHYIKSLPPVVNAIDDQCTFPPM